MKKLFFQVSEFGEIQYLSKNNVTKTTTFFLMLLFSLLLNFQSFSQTISSTGSSSAICGNCTPTGWQDTGGTPDISNRNNAGGQSTVGGGASWINSPLPLPPTGDLTWISMRDVGDLNTQLEESVTTTMGNLIDGKLYKLSIYFMSSRSNYNGEGNNPYSPKYIDAFDYRLNNTARQKIPVISSAHDKWVQGDYIFRAAPNASGQMTLTFYPLDNVVNPTDGNGNKTLDNVESIHFAVELNAIEEVDTDKDGVPDTIDIDDDNDGILDVVENTTGGIVYNPLGDEDGDLLPNYLDTRDDGSGDGSTTNYNDINGDGIPNVYDFDNDGIPNHLDLDADGDGIPDIIEGQPTATYITPTGNVGANGLDSAFENNDSSNATSFTVVNTENTGNPDYLDLDSDGDGVSDTEEANITLTNEVGKNGLDNAYDNGDDYTDTNGNFDNTQTDNFPDTKAGGDVNWRDATTSIDTDGDGVADSIDIDDDNDGIIDTVECPSIPGNNASGVQSSNSVGNANNAITSDNNRARLNSINDILIIDLGQIVAKNAIIEIESRVTSNINHFMGVDQSTTTSNFTNAKSYSWTSTNSEENKQYKLTTAARYLRIKLAVDGGFGQLEIDNVSYQIFQPICDNDGDGIPNVIDLDSDNDGIPDNIEAQATTNYVAPDTAGNTDSNGDGLNDAYDTDCTGGFFSCGGVTGKSLSTPNNHDGTDNPDYLDTDSDNDGASDRIEAGLSLSGNVGVNGLDSNYDNGDNYTDVNGSFDNTPYGELPNTSTSDSPNNVDFRDTTTIFVDTDNDGIPDTLDIDDDNDGILDTNEGYSCNSLINVAPANLSYKSQTGVIEYSRAIDGSNSNYAYFDSTTDELILDLLNIAPTGTIINLRAYGNYADTMVSESSAATSGFSSPVRLDFGTIYGWYVRQYILTKNSRYIKIQKSVNSVLYLDNVYHDGFTPPQICNNLDTDNDGIPDHLDLDSDNDGIPDNIEAQSTAGYIKPIGTDSDNDGLDNAYDTTPNGASSGAGSLGLTPKNTDGTDTADYIDLDADNDGIFDVNESGSELPNNGNGEVTGAVGINGLVNAIDNGDNYTDVNGNFDDTQTDNFTDADGDVNYGGDVDYRDTTFDLDTDKDGVPDATDIDDDNDGILDTVENSGCKGSLSYEFYDSVPKDFTVDNIPTTGADGIGNVSNFEVTFLQNIVTPLDGETYSIRYFGYIDIVVTDTYTFYLNSDDGSKLFIDGSEVVDYDGLHGAGGFVSGTPTMLNSGLHEIVVLFFERTGGHSLEVEYSSPSIAQQSLPFSILSPKTCDTDNDGIPNHHDLDSDNDGIPDSIEAQTTIEYIEPSGTDSDMDGLDNAYDTTPNGNVNGVGSIGIVPINTDATAVVNSDTTPDYLDLDSDGDGLFDVIESNGGLPNDGNGKSTGNFGVNGLNDLAETGDTDLGYTDINGQYDATQADNFPDVDGDVLTIGDVDYRDVSDDGVPMITQIYQFNNEKWIEITNIHSTKSIAANLINIQLYKNKTGIQTIAPDVTFTVTSALAPGKSVLIKNSANVIVNLESVAIVLTNNALTDIGGANDIITLSSKNNASSYKYRYDLIEAFTDKTSYVRIDEALVPNKTYTANEWVVFIDDLLNPYEVLADGGPERHPHDPLISEIINSNSEANTLLGLHKINITTRIGSVWSNGFPDRSRYTVIAEDYNHSGSKLSARKLVVDSNSKFAITDQLLVVTNNVTLTNTNDEIRLVGTSQLIQTHTETAKVTGNGKLLVDQNSTVPSFYRYNYMSSPVSTIGTNTYSIQSVLKDGTIALDATTNIGSIAKDIAFVQGYNGATTDPISIAEYWIYTYSPASNGISNYLHKYKGGAIAKGDGYIFKGSGRTQNYTFSGTPNDGTFNTIASIGANESYLIGNPFPSAMSVKKFIEDNINSTNATLYFWQHVSEKHVDSGSSGHNYAGYIGGYATRNIAMGVTANDPTLNTPVDYTLESEDANEINGTIVEDGVYRVVSMNSANNFIKYDKISRGVDFIRVIYKSAFDKNIKIKVNNTERGEFVLPATAGVYDEAIFKLCIETGSNISFISNDLNVVYIDNVRFEDLDGQVECAPSIGGNEHASSYIAPEPYIAIGQGFFIVGDETDGGPIVFNNSQREYQTEGTGSSVFLKSGKSKSKSKKSSQFELPIIKLGMNYTDNTGTALHRQIGASFHSSNSFGFDKGYDSEMYDVNATDLYWEFPNNQIKYVITGVQEISSDLEVPLVITMAYNGSVTLGIDEIKYINQNVFIKDKLTGKTQKINKESASFQLNIGTYSDRFSLVFSAGATLSNENIDAELNNSLSLFMDNKAKEIVIQNDLNLKINKVELFNILGQKVNEWNGIDSKLENRLKLKDIPTAVYIVNIKTAKGVITKKVFYEK
ncbi:hypothetical protein CW731_12835 [Polaribacter sp. ALD11]|uniref:PA14 domain-containing protein n=1 Tax=Polaribacter sp. ALD11 TaxID=2058137 RepID=UPI000C300674|nr:PA14 domain-containing protein [Polaribacter sp. ALD11]AUC86112.1 hypothetical protein CW731_12835 [Polaribacter sp. ALD11]